MKFKNEVAVVTGGYSGIGAAVVSKLIKEGAICIIIGRSRSKANNFLMENSNSRYLLDFFQTDIGEPEQIKKTITSIKDKYGKIHMLVNCAGVNIRKAALSFTVKEWKQVLDVNLNGTFYMSQAVAEIMKEHRAGRIVNIGSMISHYGVPNVAAYAAAKGGINQLTKALSVEWAEYQIRVNQVSPGYIETPLTKQTFENASYKDTIINRTPLGRLARQRT